MTHARLFAYFLADVSRRPTFYVNTNIPVGVFALAVARAEWLCRDDDYECAHCYRWRDRPTDYYHSDCAVCRHRGHFP